MAREASLTQVSDQHRTIENQIEAEMLRPNADNLKISELKREKLRLKEIMTSADLSTQQVA